MRKLIFAAILTSTVSFSQVGIGTQTPSSKSILDLTATDKGLLLPRMTTAQRISIAPNTATDKGMQVFDTTTNTIWFWNGSIWINTDVNDKTNDAFVNNSSQRRVELGTNSDGTTARTVGAEFVIKDNGNIGIGTSSPDAYAKLDVSSTNQGILVPRVNLTSTTLDLNADGDGSVSNQPVGLLVFNTGTAFAKGFYFWNGAEWRTVDNSTALAPSITSLNCSSSFLSPSVYTAGVPYSGIMSVPYSGGNGGVYSAGTAIASTGVSGLQAVLQAGTLAVGSGNLIYTITGTPNQSSPAIANFSIPNIMGATGCVSMVGQGEKGMISQYAQVSADSYTSAGDTSPVGTLATIYANIGVRRVVRVSPQLLRIDFTVPFADDRYVISGSVLEQPSLLTDDVYIYPFFGPYTRSSTTNGVDIIADNILRDGLVPNTSFQVGSFTYWRTKYTTHCYVGGGYNGTYNVGTISISISR